MWPYGMIAIIASSEAQSLIQLVFTLLIMLWKFKEELGEANDTVYPALDACDTMCEKPSLVFCNINLDARELRESGYGKSLVIRACTGDVCVTMVQWEMGSCGPEIKEAVA